ncbi:Phosphate regulon transcriptional regulatory protein PhoB [Pelagimonas phthalicica]|uniref:Phosphate regulon transcriptional regulatory protein PhoB n=1 Tax=Pelagimonas phthalicica TaxID=1037362 RepID=A0A238JAS5_9RHOB|nr:MULTISPECIES: response regulator [Roseobacteraceae]MBO9465310.1 response regulator [Tropicibacter sp. R15_0]TDS93992.1 two-component system chemotaxis response regulator CheY [Pelagimonas phthalicica]SMX27483.1 Phosphate regulon transcriptional regulatory protein PhoB [Pelagimonas phthalicica]
MTKTVLTVDDSKAVRDMVTFTLEPEGYQVVAAENGQDGLDKLRAARPNLVITDLNMPVMNGLDFITHARSDPAGSGIPIVMLTTESAPEMKAKGKAAGATGWINKPFDADKLVAVTKKLLG